LEHSAACFVAKQRKVKRTFMQILHDRCSLLSIKIKKLLHTDTK